MAVALVGLFSCKKENLDDQNQSQTPTPSDTTSQGGEPAAVNPFVGSWDMMFVEGATVHMTVTFSDLLRLALQAAGQDMDLQDMDQDVSMEGTAMAFEVAEGTGGNLDVTGSMTVNLGMGDPATFSFTTTATYANGTMSIAPAQISETLNVMSMPIELSGTITFVQPTAAPVEDNLSIELASMSINGSGTLMSIPNAVAVTVNGSNLPANGPRAEETGK